MGAGAVLLLWTATAWLRRRRAPALAVIATGTATAAGVLLLASADTSGTARQVLAVVALGAVVAGILPAPPRVPRRRAAEPGRA